MTLSSRCAAATQDLDAICAAQVGWAYPKFDECVARLGATALGPTVAQGEVHAKPRIVAHYLKLDSHHPGWTSTGLSVATGDTLRFRATGTFVWDPSTKEPIVGPDGASWTPDQVSHSQDFSTSCGADCVLNRPGRELGVPNWPIGALRSIPAKASGELFLGINERWVPGAWDDNQGTLQVSVIPKKPGSQPGYKILVAGWTWNNLPGPVLPTHLCKARARALADMIRQQYELENVVETATAVAYYGLGSGGIDAIIACWLNPPLLMVHSEGYGGGIPDQHREGLTNFIMQKWIEAASAVNPQKENPP